MNVTRHVVCSVIFMAISSGCDLSHVPGDNSATLHGAAVFAGGNTGDPIAWGCDNVFCYIWRSVVLVTEGGEYLDLFAGDAFFEGSGYFEDGHFDQIFTEDLRISGEVSAPCPRGYTREYPEDDPPDVRYTPVVCVRHRGELKDEMVQVGDIWVDRYEASVWGDDGGEFNQYGADEGDYPSTFPYHGQFEVPLYAYSVWGVLPSRYLTWFQAQAACAASGKHLITNAEWQAAVIGTHDPGDSTANGPCLTGGDAPRFTGRAGETPGGDDSCISIWGVEDMIGNLQEWVSNWYGQGATASGAQPSEYFNDRWRSVDPADIQGPYSPHFPAAGLRGGYWEEGIWAGAFSFKEGASPAQLSFADGFRCARSF